MVEAYMAGLTGCAITGLVVVGWPIIGPGCTELPGIHPGNMHVNLSSVMTIIVIVVIIGFGFVIPIGPERTELQGFNRESKVIIIIIAIVGVVTVIVTIAIFIIFIFKYCHRHYCYCHYCYPHVHPFSNC